jgi:hypothetical protein
MIMPETESEAALRGACTQPGCPLCRIFAASARRYLDYWAYEGFTDGGVMQEVADGGGFCEQHTRDLIARGAALPLARLAQRLVAAQRRRLAVPPRRHAPLPVPVPPRCPACAAGAVMAGYGGAALAGVAADPASALHVAFAQSHGLCPAHLEDTLRRCQGIDRAHLVAAQETILARLAADLEQVVTQFDYRHGGAPHGPHAAAWRDAAHLLSGADRFGVR